MLRERLGIKLVVVPIDATGGFDLAACERLIGPRTKLVAVTHIANATGALVPVEAVARLAHAKGAKLLVDGAQAAPRMAVDVQALGCDFYAFSGHKTYGPSGIGVLYAKKKHLDAMPPYQGGGEMIELVEVDRITYGKVPHKFEAGTPAIVEAVGLGAALAYMMQVGRDRIARHEAEIGTYAAERLAEVPGLTIHGTAKAKGAIHSFSIDGLHPHDVSTIIDRSGIAIRAGHHCAQPLMERLGVTATCRASFAMYNTKAEVDALVAALIRAKDFFA
jgi:cysteine desulfurase/selenocysteine lyase